MPFTAVTDNVAMQGGCRHVVVPTDERQVRQSR